MQIILAVEPDRRQAAQLSAIVRHRVGAELVLADTTERALDVLGARVPDLVLVPALLSPQDDAALAAALRVIAAAAHVRTLTIPVLGSGSQQTSRGGLLSRLRRGRAESPAPDGCDPAVFAEQITAYLKEAATERAELDEFPKPARKAIGEPAAVAADTLDAPMSAAATGGDEIAADAPVLDLSSALGALAPPADDHNPFGGEPFGTYTLPPLEEVQAEAGASLEASAGLDVRETWDVPSAFETPAMFDQRGVEAPLVVESSIEPRIDVEEPVVLEEPFVFEGPIILSEPVVFEPPAIFEEPILLESPAFSDSPVMFDSPEVVEAAAALDTSTGVAPREAVPAAVVADSPAVAAASVFEAAPVVNTAPVVSAAPVVTRPAVPAVAAPVAFERHEVLELMAPVGMTPWRAWPPIEGVPIEVPGITAAAKSEVPDWSELMASLRQDMERRRTQERRPAAARKPRSKSAKPAVDEWGFFDPEQCGFSALLAKLDEITTTSNST